MTRGRSPSRRKWRGQPSTALLILASVFMCVALAYFFASRQAQAFLRSQTEFAAQEVAQRLDDHVRSRLAVVQGLAREAAERDEPFRREEFAGRAREILRTFPGFQALNWVDRGGVIRWVVPLEGNEGALGKRPSHHPIAKHAFGIATTTLGPTMTEPLKLFQGGVGFAMYFPVVRHDEVAGYVNAVFRVDGLARTLLSEHTQQYFDFALQQGEQQLFVEGTAPNLTDPYLADAEIELLQGKWRLLVVPGTPLLSLTASPLLKAWALGSLLVGLGLSFVFYRYTILLRKSDRRAHSLGLVNETLLRAAKIVSEFETNEESCVEQLTRMCSEALGVTRAALWKRDDDDPDCVVLVAMFDALTEDYRRGIVLRTTDYPDYWTALCRDGSVIVDDAARDRRTKQLHQDFLVRFPRVALLDVAVQVGQDVRGLFSFHHIGESRRWTPEENILVRSVADLVAQVFARSAKVQAELNVKRQAAAMARHAGALGEIAEVLGPDQSFEVGVRRVNEIVSRTLSLVRVTTWSLLEDEALQLDAFDTAHAAHESGLRVPLAIHAGIRERTAGRRCLTIPDLGNDPDYAGYYAERLAHLGELTALQALVRSHGRVIGLVSLLRSGTHAQWTTAEEIFASAVADMLSLHLEMLARAEAEEAQARQTAALRRQAAALASVAALSLDDPAREAAFRHLTATCAEALDVTSAAIWLETGPAIYRLEDRFVVSRREHECGTIMPAGAVPEYYERLVHERCVAIVDGANDPAYQKVHAVLFPDEAKLSVLAAAVRLKGRPVGVVSFVVEGQLRQWTVEEEFFVGALSDLVSLTLESAARLTAEQQTRESRKRLSLLIEGTPLAAIDWDVQGRVIGWNPAAERMFGYSRSEALNLPLGALFGAQYQDRMQDGWEQLRAGAGLVERVENLDKAGSPLMCEWRNTLLLDGTGKEIGVASLVEDVTERLRREAEIRSLNEGLEQRVKDRTAELEIANQELRTLDRLKTEFLATMSHELRTPLNSVIGFSAVLKSGKAGPVNDEQAKQLGMISTSARHLLGLINDLLDVSRIEAGKMRIVAETFSVQNVVEEACKTLLPIAGAKRLELTVHNRFPGVELNTDRTRYFQILVNLLNNAVKFTEQGQVRITVSKSRGGVLVEVTDTGPGIAQQDLQHLFKAFRQVDGSAQRVHEGTGLGLYLCEKLSRLLHGRVGVTSQVGVGSCFSLWVPLSFDEVELAAMGGSSGEVPTPDAARGEQSNMRRVDESGAADCSDESTAVGEGEA